MAGIISVTLERDGHDQQWGFRLQGGADLGTPLSVQRVMVGTPAEGLLKRGDVILKIGNVDVKTLSHQQAADMFAYSGNQITTSLKRATIPPPTKTVTFSSKSIISSAKSHEPFSSSLSRSATLPKNFMRSGPLQKSTTTANIGAYAQPYRGVTFAQPSKNLLAELGPGSYSHMKKQIDRMGGFIEHDPVQIHKNVGGGVNFGIAKHQVYRPIKQDLIIPASYSGNPKLFKSHKGWRPQKVASGYQPQHNSATPFQASSLPSPAPIPISPIPQPKLANPTMKKSLPISYNSPIGLYSASNVAEVAQMNQQGKAPIPSMNRQITPNRPQQVVLNPKKDYNPQDSATWRALQEESEMPLDPSKLQNYSSLKEHDPIYSSVYTAPKHPMNAVTRSTAIPHINSPTPQSPARSPLPGGTRSPVADLLPASYGGQPRSPQPKQELSQDSAALRATLAEPTSSPSHLAADERIPIYETNAIGGKKRITQSASFNKLMMDVLGV